MERCNNSPFIRGLHVSNNITNKILGVTELSAKFVGLAARINNWETVEPLIRYSNSR